ncbi:50S ribosomal protein P1 [Candidatus Woesearchaeota archaeon]|nr:50S ribosomal protein P1 [Candidatus Woesearchaeota archaeon]
MEYVYAAMLLHKAGKKIDEESLNKVLQAAGASPNPARVKALVSALEGVDIEAAIKEATIVQAAPAAPPASPQQGKKEEKKGAEEEKKSAEQAAAGLGALFG